MMATPRRRRPRAAGELAAAAGELRAACDELSLVDAELTGLTGSGYDREAARAFEVGTFEPAVARVDAAEQAFFALMRRAGLAAVVAGGRLYLDQGEVISLGVTDRPRWLSMVDAGRVASSTDQARAPVIGER